MYKIAICDDFVEITSQIESLIQEFSQNTFQVDIYNSSETLTNRIIQNKNEYSIYFLDIEVDGKNGIEIARIIRKYDVNAFIVFITSYDEYMSEVFEVQTFDYVLKPISKRRIFDLMEKISYIANFSSKRFFYSVNNVTHYVSYGEIMYFEKQKRQTILYSKSGDTKIFYMNTTQVLDQLSEYFVQIHTSFIININSVKQISKTRVILMGDLNQLVELPLSRKYRDSAYKKIVSTFERMI